MQTYVLRSDYIAWLRPVALFISIAGVFASIAVVRGLFDPDYFWHLSTGKLILDLRSVPRTDPFSFTWFGEPWIPDQWLAEVSIAAAVRAFGAGSVLVAFGFVAALGPALIAAAALRSGAKFLSVVAVSAVITAAMVPQVTVRPQVVSFAFIGLLLALLMRVRPVARHRLWAIPALFLVWANVHGFFVVGLGVGFIYLGATLLGRTPMRSHRLLAVGVGVASLSATIVTPSGPDGLLYALSFGDAGDLGGRLIMEWQSPNFHNPQFLPFLAVLGLLLLTGARQAPGWITMVALVGAFLGLFAVRAIGVGSILIMPLLLVRVGGGVIAPSLRGVRARGIMEVVAAAAVSVILIGGALARGPVTVDGRRVPVEGTKILQASAPDARVLAAYEWGGYVIDEMHKSGGSVFVDGRMHKYQPQVMADYLSIVAAEAGWEALANDYGVDAILLPPRAVLLKGAAQGAGWCEAYRDATEVLLFRTCGPVGR